MLWQIVAMRRRSKRSATCPTTSVSANIGTNCARPTRPSANALCVSAYTYQPIATDRIWKASDDITRVPQNRRNGA
ncbi:hypothetical protein FEP76_02658 [Burkholderia multivorans]|nr:hypothetical protein [Burkholderia multivorans]